MIYGIKSIKCIYSLDVHGPPNAYYNNFLPLAIHLLVNLVKSSRQCTVVHICVQHADCTREIFPPVGGCYVRPLAIALELLHFHFRLLPRVFQI